MDQLGTNPLGILTFIVAPAILTNASSVMTLGTSNRFARAIDRARALATEVEGKELDPDPLVVLRLRQLRAAERRIMFLVRALTGFYVSVGAFATASLVSLLGAVFFVARQELPRHIALGIALLAGVVGVLGLAVGSLLLVAESRMAMRILQVETDFMIRRTRKKDG